MGGQASPPSAALPNALTATHASDTDDEIQLTTNPSVPPATSLPIDPDSARIRGLSCANACRGGDRACH